MKDRRDFLKTTAMAAGALAVPGLGGKLLAGRGDKEANTLELLRAAIAKVMCEQLSFLNLVSPASNFVQHETDPAKADGIELFEYGSSVIADPPLDFTDYGTRYNRFTATLGGVAAITMNLVARDVIDRAIDPIETDRYLTAEDIRAACKALDDAGAYRFTGNRYATLIHPDAFKDLKDNTNSADWQRKRLRLNIQHYCGSLGDAVLYWNTDCAEYTGKKDETTGKYSTPLAWTYIIGKGALAFRCTGKFPEVKIADSEDGQTISWYVHGAVEVVKPERIVKDNQPIQHEMHDLKHRE